MLQMSLMERRVGKTGEVRLWRRTFNSITVDEDMMDLMDLMDLIEDPSKSITIEQSKSNMREMTIRRNSIGEPRMVTTQMWMWMCSNRGNKFTVVAIKIAGRRQMGNKWRTGELDVEWRTIIFILTNLGCSPRGRVSKFTLLSSCVHKIRDAE